MVMGEGGKWGMYSSPTQPLKGLKKFCLVVNLLGAEISLVEEALKKKKQQTTTTVHTPLKLKWAKKFLIVHEITFTFHESKESS